MSRLNVFIRFLLPLFFLNQTVQAATFWVDGRDLKSANGEVFIPRGFNVGLDFWNSASDYVADFAQTGANTLRLNVFSYAIDANLLRRFLEAADRHKLVVIVEAHDVMGSNEGYQLLDLVNSFWLNSAIKQVMYDHRHHTLVNIANEWKGTWEDDAGWRETYAQAIRTLRNNGYPHVLVIDAPGYGQHHQAIANEGPNLLAVDRNLLFSVHLYSVFSQAKAVRDMMDTLDRFPLIIGEFGWEHGNYEHLHVDEDAIMHEARARGRGWLAWSYTGNGPNDKNLDMFENSSSVNPAAHSPFGGRMLWWGDRVIYGTNGIQATVVSAGIYGLEDAHYYEFKPSGNPSQCLDVNAASLLSGARVQQWPCNNFLAQKFRAIRQNAGWFALQNALSGKCLEGTEQGGGFIAVTQQDCSGRDKQNYRAVNVGWGYLKLVNQQNNLVLDLAGVNPQAPGTQAGQFAYSGEGDQRWSIIPTSNAYVSLQSFTLKGLAVRHRMFELWFEGGAGDDQKFRVVPGLSKTACVSLESVNLPGFFISHENFLGRLAQDPGANGTFCPRAGLSGQGISLESASVPGFYLRHQMNRIMIAPSDGSQLFNTDATFFYQEGNG